MSKLRDLCFVTDPWSAYVWRAFLAGSQEAAAVIEAGAAKVPAFPSFARELFTRLYAHDAPRVDPVRPEDAWAQRAHDALDELASFGELASRATADRLMATRAAASLLERIVQDLPAPREALPDPQEQRDRVRGLLALAGALGDPAVARTIEQERTEGRRRVDAHLAYAASIGKDDLRAALRETVDGTARAMAELDDQVSALACWDGGCTAGHDDRALLARALSSSERLQRLAREAGRMRRIAALKQRTKTDASRDELSRLETGVDLARVLPSELVGLRHPLLRKDTLRRLAEGTLCQYRIVGAEVLGRGPLVVCIDNSSSMEGARETFAKAVALALLDVALRQRRACRVVIFNHTVVRVDDWTAPIDSASLLASLEPEPAGGTDFVAPLLAALDAIRARPTLRRADVVLVTDGECAVDEAFVDEWRCARRAAEATCYAVHIGGAVPDVLAQLADTTLSLPDLAPTSVGEELFVRL